MCQILHVRYICTTLRNIYPLQTSETSTASATETAVCNGEKVRVLLHVCTSFRENTKGEGERDRDDRSQVLAYILANLAS